MIPPGRATQGGVPGETPVFTDVTGPAGIAWKHFNGESPDRFLIETSCGGAAFLDFDGDGNPDFVVTNFHDEFHALYRNGGKFPFRELSRSSGLTRFTVSYVGWGGLHRL